MTALERTPASQPEADPTGSLRRRHPQGLPRVQKTPVGEALEVSPVALESVFARFLDSYPRVELVPLPLEGLLLP
jgi:hypothetical protein